MILTQDDIDKLIAIMEGVESFKKIAGEYFACSLMADNGVMTIGLNDTGGMKFEYKIKLQSSKFKTNRQFYFNPSYFLSILKSLKDLKCEKTMMFLNDTDPMLFYTKNLEYVFRFAFNRLLVKERKAELPESEQLGFSL